MPDYTLKPTQDKEADFWASKTRIFNNSDPGTGKTLASLEGYKRSMRGRLLVVAPLSILRPSWGDDIDKFMPGFTWAVAHGTGNIANKRRDAFNSNADIVMINHDGVKWIDENRDVLKGFSHCVIDEYDAFKNRTSARSKSALILANEIEYLTQLSGTPNGQSVTDIWHPAFMLDRGQRLGNNFFKFRSQVQIPLQVGPDKHMVNWEDKPGAVEQVTSLLADITIRHELQNVPGNHTYKLFVDMPKQVMAQYYQLEKEFVLELKSGLITAVNAGVKAQKLRQLLSGAIYDSSGRIVKAHQHRAQLVIDLVMARDQSLVAFNWSHERDGLVELAKKNNISYGVIDGEVPVKQREQIVNDYQAGKLKVIFAHPQSAGHGLTLTAGTTTIWASPIYRSALFKQFNRRIHRHGQTKETETICICARNTKEADVYDRMESNLDRMNLLLDIFSSLTEAA